MRSFEVMGESCEAFVDRVREAIRGAGFDDIVTLTVDGDRLVVRFKWAGESVLRFRLRRMAVGFRAELEKQRMSPFHAPFRSGFEDRFEQVIRDAGATLL